MLRQKFVDLAEGLAAEKAPVGGQGTGMRSLENQAGKLGSRRHGGLFLRLGAPEYKRHRLGQIRQGGHHMVGKGLPAQLFMAVGLSLLHAQHRVQQKQCACCENDEKWYC